MATAISSVDAHGRLNSGKAMMASNFETFLTLLTTQMKNQDPLSPLDSNEFTAQLTQMAGVEQQLLTIAKWRLPPRIPTTSGITSTCLTVFPKSSNSDGNVILVSTTDVKI